MLRNFGVICAIVATGGRNLDAPGTCAIKRESFGWRTKNGSNTACKKLLTLPSADCATFRDWLGVCCVNREPITFPI